MSENYDVNPALDVVRDRVDIEVGAFVRRGTSIYKISQILDFESAIGVDVESGRSAALRLGELSSVPSDRSTTAAVDMAEIADEDWRIAEKRYSAIKPILDGKIFGRDAIEEHAAAVDVDAATLYRWLQRYRAYGVVSALIPQKRGWKQGKGRISVQAEEVVSQVLNDFYLTAQRPSAQKAILEVQRRCSERGIQPPGESVIRSRIANLPERDRLRKRGYQERAKNRFTPAAGSFPNADYPLAVVQIDHTPADIILVDDVHRKPIGRPWITLAMDVCTRMVTGYYLSFDPPSETSVAMCVAHSILPKEDWLTLHNVDADWPVWGVPRTIHVDNGADFRSNGFQQSCLMYGIHLEFRPVKQPRYGGHIERMLGTLLREIHALPGTTFSSVAKRDGYDAEKNAALTKSEFEEWMVSLICKVYHKRMHSSLMMTPYRHWELGIFGSAERPGIGIPPRPAHRHSILLDFLPSFSRTIQPFGVTIDGMSYYAEALRPWINATDKDGKKREFVFRRDPRDISAVWFFDPQIKQYFKVPFADQALPAMSIWEYREARAKLKHEGRESLDTSSLLRAVTELRTKVEQAQEKTKQARKQAQRRKEHERKVDPNRPLPSAAPPGAVVSKPANTLATLLLEDDVEAVGDIA